MSIQGYLLESREIQRKILDYLNNDDNDQIFKDLIKLFDTYKIRESENKLIQILHIIICISNNNHRLSNFYFKIDKILLFFKDSIKSFYSNSEIFNIFKENKRILLFLINENIMTINKSIWEKMRRYKDLKYHLYFYPELHKYDANIEIQEKYLENFEENRKIGENENYICELIRNDMIIEFIVYVNKTNFPIKTFGIKPSIFETNRFLMDKCPTIIEYSAFFGSIQIFKYLIHNDAELSSPLWLYAIHGANAEMIHLLEELNIEPYDQSYVECAKEALKCFHNNIYDFILNNLLQIENEKNPNFTSCIFENHNFEYINQDMINQSYFNEICKFDYYDLVKFLLDNNFVDINHEFSI